MARTAIFLDGAYIEKTLEAYFQGVRIDYLQLANILSADTELLRCYYYHCPPYCSQAPTEDEQQRLRSKTGFFRALSNIPRFQVQLGWLAYRGDNQHGKPIFIQKAIDVLLAVDMVQLAATKTIDKIVLVAGDSDFEPAIRVAKTYGVLTTLCHGPQNNGQNPLWEVCDERMQLTQEIIDQIKRTRKTNNE